MKGVDRNLLQLLVMVVLTNGELMDGSLILILTNPSEGIVWVWMNSPQGYSPGAICLGPNYR